MKRMKRLLAMLLVVATLCTTGILTTGASAADNQEAKAKVLFSLGLFKGYDTTGTNLGLADNATREHAILFLIRMLGEEKAAAAWSGAQPYSDVPSSNYFYPYIGYAKDKGYTKGLGDNQFGLGQSADMKQMTVFALRGLGYSESASDFTYQNSLDFAKSKGILESTNSPANFTRGDAVDVIFGATFSNMKGKSTTLLEKLVADGVVTADQVAKANTLLNEKPTQAPAGDTATASKALVERYNKAIARYNAQIEQLKALGADSNPTIVSTMDSVTSAFNTMKDVLSTGSSNYTATQLADYNKAMDTMDIAMDSIDTLIAAAKKDGQPASKPTSITVPVLFENKTGVNIAGIYFSPNNSDDWGTSIGSLKKDQTGTLNVQITSDTLKWDLMVSDGTTEVVFDGLDFSGNKVSGITVTLTMDDNGNVKASW